MIKTLLKRYQYWHTDTRGNVLIEFAILLPLLILFAFPVIDFSRYILLQQKAIKASSVIADSIAMSVPLDIEADESDFDYNSALLTTDLIEEYADLATLLMTPYGSKNPINVTISNIDKDTGDSPRISWQYNSTDGYSTGITEISDSVPQTFLDNMVDDENLIHVTVSVPFEPFTPIVSWMNIPFLKKHQVQSTHFYRSRYGDLTTPVGNPEAAEFPCVPAEYEDCSTGKPPFGYQCTKVPDNCPCPGGYETKGFEDPRLKVCWLKNPCHGLSKEECYSCESGEVYVKGKCETKVECEEDEWYRGWTNTCHPRNNNGGGGGECTSGCHCDNSCPGGLFE